jgi:hypothetical protein
MILRVISIAAALGLVLALATRSQAQEIPLLDLLVERLADYLSKYESELSTVIADERYSQSSTRRTPVGGGSIFRSRRLDSEIAFLRLPGGGEWFGSREVRKVDNKPVTGADLPLAALLAKPQADFISRARAIVDASSRHNLDLGRTINMPTVPLEALSLQNHPRFIFKIRGTDRINGVRTHRLDFEEFDEPTLVQSVDGGSLWSRGSAWLEAETGRLWRAELIVGPVAPGGVRRPAVESTVRVEFTRDPGLDMLVPKEMQETFWVPRGRGTGRATYSNFRRFSVSTRILPQ